MRISDANPVRVCVLRSLNINSSWSCFVGSIRDTIAECQENWNTLIRCEWSRCVRLMRKSTPRRGKSALQVSCLVDCRHEESRGTRTYLSAVRTPESRSRSIEFDFRQFFQSRTNYASLSSLGSTSCGYSSIWVERSLNEGMTKFLLRSSRRRKYANLLRRNTWCVAWIQHNAVESTLQFNCWRLNIAPWLWQEFAESKSVLSPRGRRLAEQNTMSLFVWNRVKWNNDRRRVSS